MEQSFVGGIDKECIPGVNEEIHSDHMILIYTDSWDFLYRDMHIHK